MGSKIFLAFGQSFKVIYTFPNKACAACLFALADGMVADALLSKLLIVGRYGFFGAEVHEETVDFVTKMYQKNLLLQEITKHGFGEGSFNEAIVLRFS